MNSNRKKGGIYAPSNQSKPTEKIELTLEAKILLKEASEDSHGIIIRVPSHEGTQIFTNQKSINNSNDLKEIKKWDGAIQELNDFGYLEPIEDGELAFRVTQEGYNAPDKIRLC